MKYTHDGQEYELNLIDTPGHVDFHYEVSRSRLLRRGGAAGRCVSGRRGPDGGQRLRGDATRPDDRAGDQQDRPHARPGRRSPRGDGAHAGDRPDEVLAAAPRPGWASTTSSAAVIERVPPPAGDPDATLQAMVFDSHYDEYRGAVTYVRVDERHGPQGPEDPFCRPGTPSTRSSSWASSCPTGVPATSSRPARSATSSATSSRSATSTSATR